MATNKQEENEDCVLVEETKTKANFNFESFEVNGIKFHDAPTTKNIILNLVPNFKVRNTDLFLLGYPKTGNHWLKYIIALLYANGDTETVESNNIDDVIGFLEFFSPRYMEGETEVQTFERWNNIPESQPRIFSSHLHWEFLPQEIRDGKCKTIIMVRNPKDVAVSLYKFVSAQKYFFRCKRSFDEFLKIFLEDSGPPYGIGSYFRYYVEYWKSMQEMLPLILHYEDMVHDLKTQIKRIAQYLQKTVSDDIIEKIANASHFDNMKLSKSMVHLDMTVDTSLSSFFRKGATRDWKNNFTVEQNKFFDEVQNEIFKTTNFKPKYE